MNNQNLNKEFKNAGKQLSTFMRRDDLFPNNKESFSIYIPMNNIIMNTNYHYDTYNIEQLQNLFNNRAKYLLVTTTRQMCDLIYKGFEKETDTGEGEGGYILFNKIIHSLNNINTPTSIYSNVYIRDEYHLLNTDIYCGVFDDSDNLKIKNPKIILENAKLEGMNKAEVLFNMFLQGKILKTRDKEMSLRVGTIADIYTYTLMKILLEYIFIYLPKILPNISIEQNTFVDLMNYYNKLFTRIETMYNTL